MDRSLLRKAAIQSVALMIAVVTLSYALKHYETITIAASSLLGDPPVSTKASAIPDDAVTIVDNSSEENKAVPTDSPTKTVNTPITDAADLRSRIDDSIRNRLSDNFLVVRKPKGEGQSMQLEDLYINHSIQLNITGSTESNLTGAMFFRVKGDQFFTGDPVFEEITTTETDEETGISEEIITKDYGEDICHSITISSKLSEDGSYRVQALLELDRVYAYIMYEDSDYYYIDLRNPSEVYDKIVVIDAGHGGKDAGAISRSDKYYEKDINVGIVQQLKSMLEQEDIKVYYTRTADDKVFLRPRVTLANAVDCDYFISIHCNANEVSSPNGTEVLYYDTDFKGVKSKDLASLFSEELAKSITLKSKGIVQRHMEDIFIMDKSLVPTILIEVGYITNKGDLDYLTRTENQRKVAQGIYQGILRAYEELPTKN